MSNSNFWRISTPFLLVGVLAVQLAQQRFDIVVEPQISLPLHEALVLVGVFLDHLGYRVKLGVEQLDKLKKIRIHSVLHFLGSVY